MSKLQPHQERVVAEADELAGRLKKLEAFANGGTFQMLDGAEQFRLIRQAGFMKAYLDVLHERINAFHAG